MICGRMSQSVESDVWHPRIGVTGVDTVNSLPVRGSYAFDLHCCS